MKPQLYKTIFQIRYKPDLSFYSMMYDTAKAIDGFPDWETNKLTVTLKNFEKRCNITITHSFCAYEQDLHDDNVEEKNVSTMITALADKLKISKALRVGYRRRYLIPVEMHYDRLVSLLELKLLNPNILEDKEIGAIGDLAYVIDLKDAKFKMHLMIGPTNKEEAPRFVQFNRSRHINNDDKLANTAQYVHLMESYPETSVFFDMDVYKEDESGIPVSDIKQIQEEAKNKIEQTVSAYGDYFFNEKILEGNHGT